MEDKLFDEYAAVMCVGESVEFTNEDVEVGTAAIE
jgi:hypothetical protein